MRRLFLRGYYKLRPVWYELVLHRKFTTLVVSILLVVGVLLINVVCLSIWYVIMGSLDIKPFTLCVVLTVMFGAGCYWLELLLVSYRNKNHEYILKEVRSINERKQKQKEYLKETEIKNQKRKLLV